VENKMHITPLETWTAANIGLSGPAALNLTALRNYQLGRFNDMLAHAAAFSPFYRKRLSGTRHQPLQDLSETARLPFTTADDLRAQGLQMLAVSQGAIERIVTLRSSGTTGQPKRLFFTAEDLERTRAFFRCGMSQMLQPGHRVLVLLPGDLPDSQGRLLADALQVMDVACHIHGLVEDAGQVAALLAEQPFDCVVGIPVQVLGVVRHPRSADVPHGRIGSVFLTSDYVPEALVRDIRQRWGCAAFNHYGMTELGLTGGVECQALDGYHLREPDFYFEIVDPASGRRVPDGTPGEVIVTTLRRTGMPLIRYRTGDLACFLTEPCPCGSKLPRLSKLGGRLAARIDMGGPQPVGMPELDEALFDLPGLLNYRALFSTRYAGAARLQITIETSAGTEQITCRAVDRRLATLASLKDAVAAKRLTLLPTVPEDQPLPVSATAKRLIEQTGKEY
jgi:phenylacetate-coenzyme A ligase PaaK-like adenylate-forming protein